LPLGWLFDLVQADVLFRRPECATKVLELGKGRVTSVERCQYLVCQRLGLGAGRWVERLLGAERVRRERESERARARERVLRGVGFGRV